MARTRAGIRAALRQAAAHERRLAAEEAHPRASQYLDEDLLRGLSRAELRAVAASRGYSVPRVGSFTVEDFIKLQHNDDRIEMPSQKAAKKRR